MNRVLEECLADLEARIDPQEEERLLQEWIAFSEGRFRGQIFSPKRSKPSPPAVQWPKVSINEGLRDYDLMALQQYGMCSNELAAGSGAILNVRCNYGTSIVPLLFGVKLFIMDDELDTLPAAEPYNDLAAIERLVERGVPKIEGGLVEKVFEMAEHYKAIGRRYPKIGRYVQIYHPDLQGPLDICEIVWGSTIFYALYDRPELVKALLEIVTQTYIAFMHAWMEVVPPRKEGNAHWGLFHKGNVMLRDDSAMNLSPDMFEEFVRPYDQRILDEFGGGAVHFCGKGDHYIAKMSRYRGLYAINLSQPEYNNMETIFAHTVDKGIAIIGLRRDAAEAAVAAGRDLHGRVHAS